MKYRNFYGISVLQVVISCILLPVLYFFFDPLNSLVGESDFINIIIGVVIVPLGLTLITVMVCMIAGLPFHFIPGIRNWWISKPVLQIVLLFTGIIILFLSSLDILRIPKEFTVYEMTETKLLANEWISMTGWFLTAFSLININPSVVLDFIQKRFIKNNWSDA